MGRGRAKAKQTKVARQLKYGSGPQTDFDRLQAELAGSPVEYTHVDVHDDEDDEDDPYAKYYEDDDEEDDGDAEPRASAR